jgi:hypothetical protein
MREKAPRGTIDDDLIGRGGDGVTVNGLGREDILPAAPGPATCTRSGDDFLFTWSAEMVAVAVTAIKEQSDGYTAELAVSLNGNELHWGRVGLASTQGRLALAKRLALQHRALAWGTVIEHACRETVRALREGAPAVRLTARPFVGPRFSIEPFVWHEGCSFTFADGGSGKGWLAQLLAIVGTTARSIAGLHPRAGRGLHVLYLDWESSQEDLDDRLARLGQGLGIDTTALPIFRLGMDRPLAADLVRVRAECARTRADLLIVDSWMPACGISRDSSGLDTAIGAFQAVRTLGRPAFCIAHLSKVMADQKGAARIFGSVFNHNLSRNVWEIKRAEDATPGTMVLGCYHTKVNEVALRKPFGLRFDFDGDDGSVTVAPCTLTEGGSDLLDKPPLRARIRTALATGSLTSKEVADHLGISPGAARARLNELLRLGHVVRLNPGGHGTGNGSRWGLATRDA